jgi:hypothetical protein
MEYERDTERGCVMFVKVRFDVVAILWQTTNWIEKRIQVVVQVEFSNTIASVLEGEVDNLLVSLVSIRCLCKTYTHAPKHKRKRILLFIH